MFLPIYNRVSNGPEDYTIIIFSKLHSVTDYHSWHYFCFMYKIILKLRLDEILLSLKKKSAGKQQNKLETSWTEISYEWVSWWISYRVSGILENVSYTMGRKSLEIFFRPSTFFWRWLRDKNASNNMTLCILYMFELIFMIKYH